MTGKSANRKLTESLNLGRRGSAQITRDESCRVTGRISFTGSFHLVTDGRFVRCVLYDDQPAGFITGHLGREESYMCSLDSWVRGRPVLSAHRPGFGIVRVVTTHNGVMP